MSRAVLSNHCIALVSCGTIVDVSAEGVRARVRAELTEEIKAVARRNLAESGAAALSLRAVARELGMASSAVYRYFPSRDDLLTALIVDSYLSLGAEVHAAAQRRGAVEHRFLACGHAVREWAVARPHEWALLFGSPVPGYAAPEDTIDPAAVAPLALLGVVADGVETGAIRSAGVAPRSMRGDMARLRTDTDFNIPDDVLLRALGAWATLIGLVSVELFGHTKILVTDHAAFFDTQQRALWEVVAGG